MKWISVSEKLPELTIHENEPFIGEWDNSEPVLVYHSDDKWECKYLVAQYTNGFADVGEPILYGWVDINDGEEVKGVLAWMPLPQPYTADRKTENSSENPNNSTISKMEQVDKDINVRSKDCETCKHYKLACELFSEICKYEPTTQTETQNSNLTLEKDECAKEYEELGLKELKELIKVQPQTDCAWR